MAQVLFVTRQCDLGIVDLIRYTPSPASNGEDSAATPMSLALRMADDGSADLADALDTLQEWAAHLAVIDLRFSAAGAATLLRMIDTAGAEIHLKISDSDDATPP